MHKRFDMTGKRFGYLLVVSQETSKNNKRRWKCMCDCGNYCIAYGTSLRSKHSSSCGCRMGGPTHGHTRNRKTSPTYKSWQSMISRCTHPSSPAFEYYKKRGITVCDSWRNFDNFLEDMGDRPPDTTLDRINNHGGYEPKNCRWATKREQANNRVTNLIFNYNGQDYTLADLARYTGVSKEMLRSRLCRSNLPWTVEGAVETPKLTRTNWGFYK